jgi:putative colanic acid biosynthesis glycosyltransferase
MDTRGRCAILRLNAMSAPPTFSVIVVCKNPGPCLRAALATVWEQQQVTVELIVIDGGSTDGTREWLEMNRARIAALVSEPDRGVYDAMNKGIPHARGEWIYFLGADDRLVSVSVLSETASWLRKTDAGIVAGEVAFVDGRIYKLSSEPNVIARNFVHHQGTFYRRNLFEKIASFDPTLRVMADYDLNVRLWQQGVRFESIPTHIASCGIGGVSDGGDWRVYREEIAVRHRHFPLWRSLPWDAISVVRYLRKQIVRFSRR